MKIPFFASFLLLTAALSVSGHAADTFEPVPVKIAEAVEVPVPLARLLADLAAATDAKNLPTVRSHVGSRFSWDSDHGGGYQASLPAYQNFVNALSLDPKNIKAEYLPISWMTFKVMLEARTASRYKPGSKIICLPGKGTFLDASVAEKTAEKLGTDPWFGMMFSYGFPAAVRAAPDFSAEVVGTIIDEAVIVRHELRTDPDAEWEPVHLASGALGWAPKDRVRSFLDPQLCFAETEEKSWKIVGYNGGGD